MMIVRTGVLVAATLLAGLMAGLFFAYSCSVMPGLAATDDRSFVQTMQWINRRILNGWFLTAFLGSMVLIVAAVALHYADGPVLVWTGAALVLYGATLVITMRWNVPLNDQLDRAGPADDPAAIRERFEAPWVRWNLARTITSVAAFGCLIGALVGSD
ncbi:DUF1772 domain-containing protein [Micromonospora sp. DR5-3]|uniref:anthrone oxygenase family protein n=1 Tax=unclassified Micromonospora TaxID=2617518 RepID=UPI0011D9A58A|nr:MULTISPECIES: anthrone oxygenase family protein [unclassified Micromonospora]MCW3818843.1 DUF1772 domain-containing protein [Micromonospora sp. DR5-3]TYC25732.1 DUF1772 domain-containing protein [Micromonospora sp. MP36]